MPADMDKAFDLLLKLMSDKSEDRDNEDYNEIVDNNTESDEETTPEESPQLQNIFGAFSENDDKRVTLLSSIKPYMSGKRQGKVDAAIQIVRLISLSSGLGITNLFKQ